MAGRQPSLSATSSVQHLPLIGAVLRGGLFCSEGVGFGRAALLLYHGASLLCGERNMRTVIVALLSGVVGSVLTYLIHRREIGVKMIEVAIGILRASLTTTPKLCEIGPLTSWHTMQNTTSR